MNDQQQETISPVAEGGNSLRTQQSDPATWRPSQYPLRDPRSKSPLLAAAMSLIPGLGQIYVGYYQRGFIHPLVVGGILSVMVAKQEMPTWGPLAVMFIVFFWLYNIIDAWRRATFYNLALEGIENIQLPDDLKSPGFKGNVFTGTILFIASFVVLLYTKFDMPIEVIEQWWPLIPMAFGAYLVIAAIIDKKNAALD